MFRRKKRTGKITTLVKNKFDYVAFMYRRNLYLVTNVGWMKLGADGNLDHDNEFTTFTREAVEKKLFKLWDKKWVDLNLDQYVKLRKKYAVSCAMDAGTACYIGLDNLSFSETGFLFRNGHYLAASNTRYPEVFCKMSDKDLLDNLGTLVDNEYILSRFVSRALPAERTTEFELSIFKDVSSRNRYFDNILETMVENSDVEIPNLEPWLKRNAYLTLNNSSNLLKILSRCSYFTAIDVIENKEEK